MDISHAHIAGDSTLLLHRQTLYSMTLSHVHVVRHAGSSMALYAGRLMVINFAEQIYGCTVTQSNTTHEAEKKQIFQNYSKWTHILMLPAIFPQISIG